MNHSPFAPFAMILVLAAADKGAFGLLEWDKADRRVKVILALGDRDGL